MNCPECDNNMAVITKDGEDVYNCFNCGFEEGKAE